MSTLSATGRPHPRWAEYLPHVGNALDVTTVTAVTGNAGERQGAYLRVEIAARAIQSVPLTFPLRRTLAG